MEQHTEEDTSEFLADFIDGYSFRNLIEYLRSTNTHGNIMLDKDGIYYQQSDANESLINDFEIDASELVRYEFYSDKEHIVLGININDMRTLTKSIGKKDSVRLYKLSQDPILYIQIMNSSERSADRSNMSIIRPQKLHQITYVLPEYTKPNLVVHALDFSKACAGMSTIKCPYVQTTSTGKGIVFKAVMNNGIVGKVESLGDTKTASLESTPIRLNIVDRECYANVNIKASTVKALSKINNLTSNGTVKIYTEKDKPLKFVTKIGIYGTLSIYVRSIEE